MGAKEQKEEENISEFFFWKNAAEPRMEARGFIREAELAEWKDARGRSLDTQRKVLTWADGWELRHGSQRTDPKFLKLWNMLYCFLLIEGNPVAPHLLSKRVSFECTDADCTLYASSVVVNFLVDNIEQLPDTDPKKCILKAIRNNRQLFYQAYTL